MERITASVNSLKQKVVEARYDFAPKKAANWQELLEMTRGEHIDVIRADLIKAEGPENASDANSRMGWWFGTQITTAAASGKKFRYTERHEFVFSPNLYDEFERNILDRCRETAEWRIGALLFHARNAQTEIYDPKGKQIPQEVRDARRDAGVRHYGPPR